MKRLAFLLILTVFTLLSAQVAKDVLLNEDFGSGTFPPAGWTISSNASNWSAYANNNAGGTAPELRFSWSPQFSGSSYFISPSFDTTGHTTLYLNFKQMVDHYDSPFTVGVASRSNNGAWNTVWSITPDESVGPETRMLTINNADVGSNNFQFAFFFSGSSYNINYWFIDDVVLKTPFQFDLAVLSTNLEPQVSGGTPLIPSCTIVNLGTATLMATVSLDIFHGDILDVSYPDHYSASISLGETQEVSFPSFTPADNELYRFVFYISSLEDVIDADPENNHLTYMVNTWTRDKQMVLLEIGTGGWCQYCPGAAMGADDLVAGGYNVAVIENHNGDPYANVTSNARNDYYSVAGFPTAIIDGMLKMVGGSNSSSMLQYYLPLYQQRNAIKAPLDLHIFGEATREGYLITLRVDKYGRIASPNLALHLALTESNINYSWQGQTHLNFVNRMMYPDYNGTIIDLVEAPLGSTDYLIAVDKEASWVAANCELVAFIQNLDTKEIIQGNKVALNSLTPVSNDDPGAVPAVTTLESISPNPFRESARIKYCLKDNAKVEISVYNIKGQLVKNLVSDTLPSGQHFLDWNGMDNNGQSLASGTYLVRMKSGSTVCTRKIMLIK